MYPELTYENFKAHGGTVSEDDFKSRLVAARAYLNNLIWPREVVTDKHRTAYIDALVASINAGEVSEVPIASKRVGNTSVTYSEAVQSQCPAKDAARNALVGSGLLFKGL